MHNNTLLDVLIGFSKKMSYRLDHQSQTKMLAAYSIFLVISLSFVAHLTLFLLYVWPSSLETVYGSNNSVQAFHLAQLFLRAVFGSSILVDRLPSVVSATATLFLIFRLATRWSGDALSGAGLTLGFTLFPIAVYMFSQALPHALTTLVFTAALYLISIDGNKSRYIAPVAAALMCASLLFLHGTGFVLFAVLLCLTFLELGNFWRSLAFLVVTVLAVALGISFLDPVGVPDFPLDLMTKFPNDLWLVTVLQTYPMIWVAQFFAILSLFGSRPLRQLLAQEGVYRSLFLLAGFFASTSVLGLSQLPPHESVEMAFAPLLSLGVLASLPMVMWIRLIMPRVRSVVIWITLPVIMYSCFWVVLGPIDLNGFPYNLLMEESIFSATQSPR